MTAYFARYSINLKKPSRDPHRYGVSISETDTPYEELGRWYQHGPVFNDIVVYYACFADRQAAVKAVLDEIDEVCAIYEHPVTGHSVGTLNERHRGRVIGHRTPRGEFVAAA